MAGTVAASVQNLEEAANLASDLITSQFLETHNFQYPLRSFVRIQSVCTCYRFIALIFGPLLTFFISFLLGLVLN